MIKNNTNVKSIKICLLSILALLFTLTSNTLKSQTISVGTETTTSAFFPLYTYYGYNYSQTIYLGTDLISAGANGPSYIDTISYYYSGISSPTTNWDNWNLYMGNSPKSSFANMSDWSTGLTQVFSGNVIIPSNGGEWIKIPLTTPFLWDGSSNLIIGLDENTPAYSSPAAFFGVSSAPDLRSILYYSDGVNPDPNSPPTANQSENSYANVKLNLMPLAVCSGTPDPALAASTSSLVCANTPFNLTLTQNTIASGISYQWQSSNDGGLSWSSLGTAQSSWLKSITDFTNTTSYKCVSTCTASGYSSTSSSVTVNLNPVINCMYCSPSVNLNCSGDKFSDFSISNVIFQPSNCDVNGYSDSTLSNNTIIQLTAGNTYSLQTNIANSGNGGTMVAGAWIDYNKDGIFQNTEYTFIGSGGSQIYTNNITVPFSASVGEVKMRFKLEANNSSSVTILDPCNNSNGATYGQVLDYKVNISPTPTCSGTPIAGNSISTKTIACENTSFNLSLTNNSIATGISYQWQSSADGVVWANLGVASNNWELTVNSLTNTTSYRCISTCTSGSLSAISSLVTVNLNSKINCHCTAPVLDCSYDTFSSVSFANITDGSIQCSSGGYSDQTSIGTVSLTANQTYSIETTIVGYTYNGKIGCWIDYDQNGIFEDLEYFNIANPSSVGTYSNNILIPLHAKGGLTKMRLMYEYYSSGSQFPCTSNTGSGRTLDYLLDITAAPLCSGTPTAGLAVSTESAVCKNTSINLNLINNEASSGINYQWQSSTNGSTWNNLTSNQIYIPYTISSQSVTTYYRAISTCLNSSLTAISQSVTVNQNPFTDCYCEPTGLYCNNNFFSKIKFESLDDTIGCLSGYENRTAIAGINPIVLSANQTYTFSTIVQNNYNNGVKGMWLDYDQNGVFDDNEYTNIGSVVNLNGVDTTITSFSIPFTAKGGLTRIRFKYEADYDPINKIYPCTQNNSNGQAIDYLVNITAAPSCSGTPTACSAVSSASTICHDIEFTLSLQGNDIVSGLKYQWQKSSDNINWIDLGAQQSFVPFTVLNQSTASYYRCMSTCSASPSSTSSVVQVLQKALNECYCAPVASDCSNSSIDSIGFANLSYTTSCSTAINGYSDFTSAAPTITVSAGESYTVGLTVSDIYNDYVGAWIDYNQDGMLDTLEYTYIGSVNQSQPKALSSLIGSSTSNSIIAIPVDAKTGTTRLRFRVGHYGTVSKDNACNSLDDGETGSNGETEDYLITILPPDCSALSNTITASVTGSLEICSGSNAELDLSPALPIANGFTYQWWSSSDGTSYSTIGGAQTTSSFTNNPSANTYYKSEVLCNGNTFLTTSPVLVKLDQISKSPVITNVSCNGVCNGSITLNASTSINTSTLNYTWSHSVAETSYSVSSLCAGTYSVLIKNSTGCSVTETLTVTEPTSITVTSAPVNVNCFGGNDGSINLTVLGGTPTYSYTWSNGSTAEDLSGVLAGTYTSTVVDANNCLVTNTFTITEPTKLSATKSKTNVTCFGLNNGAANVSVSGGTLPYTYSWLANSATTNTVNNLVPNTYTYNVLDAKGCSIADTITITEPNVLSASSTQTDVACFGLSNGSASVSVTGGVGAFTYSWSPNNNTNNLVNTLSAQTYSCFIKDANSCVLTHTLIITEPAALVAASNYTNASCYGMNDGVASFTLNGGSAPLNYTLLPVASNSLITNNLSAGNYTLSVIDNKACALTQTITISQPGAITATVTAPTSVCKNIPLTLVPTIVGGVAPYNYAWTEVPGSAVVSADSVCLAPAVTVGNMAYYLALTDGNNCTINSNTVNVTVNPSTNFSGTVTTYPSLPVAGRVVLYKYEPFYTKFDSVAGQNIGSLGEFNFNSFNAGYYIIKAIPNNSNYQITYGDSAVNWKTANQIIHGCANDDIQNINVKALNTFTTPGIGTLSGKIIQGEKYGKRMAKTSNIAFPGQPIGGIVVKGGRNPGGQMFVQTVTDANSGTYTLTGLPANSVGEEYFIVVDIPGLDTNGTYHQVITSVNNQFTNLNFIVDSAKINPINNTVSVNDISAIDNQVKVFPNPATNKVTIQYNLLAISNVKIELVDILGKSIKTILPLTEQNNTEHTFSIPLTDITAGMYFMKIKINNSESTVKLFISN